MARHPGAVHGLPSHAECLAQAHRERGRGRILQCMHHANAPVEHQVVLDALADHETRHVHEEDHGDVVRVAHGGEANDLVAGLRVEGSRLEHGVVRDDAYGVPVQPGEGAHHVAGIVRLHLEYRIGVADAGDDASHVVAAGAPGRHHLGQLGIGPVAAAWLGSRRRLPGIRGHVRQPAPDGLVPLLVGVYAEIDLPGDARVHVHAADVLERDDLAGGDLEHFRRGHGEARAAHHDDVVAHGRHERRAAERLAADHRGHRDPVTPLGHLEHGTGLGDAFGAHEIGNAAAAGLAEVHDRNAHGERTVVETGLLAGAHDRARAAQHRDVVAEHCHRPAVHIAVPADLAVARRDVAHLGAERPAERADLAKRAVVEEGIDVLADRPVAFGLHGADLRSPAHVPPDHLGSGLHLGNPLLVADRIAVAVLNHWPSPALSCLS